MRLGSLKEFRCFGRQSDLGSRSKLTLRLGRTLSSGCSPDFFFAVNYDSLDKIKKHHPLWMMLFYA